MSPQNFKIIKGKALPKRVYLNNGGVKCQDSGCAGGSMFYESDVEYFSVDNLFSEITDDYQRAIARQNLGIIDNLKLSWGNITGNLVNQQDLYKFVTESIAEESAKLLTIIDSKLENESPSGSFVTFNVQPSFKYIDEGPTDVTITWQYRDEVTEQSINGISLNSSDRTYTFKNVDSSFIITLNWVYSGKPNQATKQFKVQYPTFYGETLNTLSRTNLNTIETNYENYIYILTYKPADFSVNGFTGGFIQEGMCSVNGFEYYVYRSYNKGLGPTKVTLIW